MKSEYRLIFDNGQIVNITATCRANAIAQYCAKFGVSLEWLKSHCKIVNIGVVK